MALEIDSDERYDFIMGSLSNIDPIISFFLGFFFFKSGIRIPVDDRRNSHLGIIPGNAADCHKSAK